MKLPRRKWKVKFIVDPEYAGIIKMDDDAVKMRYFTYGGALRVANRWNKSTGATGRFEVCGPRGKGDD
jgi:hypothetical protein